MTAPSEDPVDEALAELQRESRERQRELVAIVDDLPAVTSRRVVLKEMASSVRDAPDRRKVLKRTVAKLVRLPLDVVRRAR